MNPIKPIFIVGAPRSGTTLTAQIVGRHPDVLMPGELHFLEDIHARRGEIGDLAGPAARAAAVERISSIYGRYNQVADQARVDRLLADGRRLAALRDAATGYAALLSAFMQMQMEATGKTRWGNNTPQDIFHVPEIVDFYPDARFLVCVRDVRDFLLSYRGRWRVSEHGDRLRALYHPLVTALLWKASTRVIPSFHTLVPREHWMIVHYEALVTDPEATLKKMCRTLELDFRPDMLDVAGHNSSAPQQASGIFTTSVGRWRDELPDEEVYVAERLNRRELEELGYALSKPRAAPSKLLLLLATLPISLMRALWVNRRHRGPTLPYLRRRLMGLLRHPG